MLSDPEEAAAVRRGEKTIHQAAAATKAKRVIPPAPAKKQVRSPEAQRVNDEALAEGLRIIGLLHDLAQRDPNVARRKALGGITKILVTVF